MNRKTALEILSRHRSEIGYRFGVKSLSLFGSVARDEAGAESDVDVLVDFYEPPDLSRYLEVKSYLEEILGRQIDLVMKGALQPWALPYVEAEAVDVT